MVRRTSTLGLVIVVLSASVVSVTKAHAEEEGHFLGASQVSATHVDTQIVTTDDFTALTVSQQEIECNANAFDGEIAGGTSKQLTLTPTFVGFEPCEAWGIPLTAMHNGCDFRFYTARTGAGTHSWQVETALSCPPGSPGMQVILFSNDQHAFRLCIATIPPQQGVQGATIHSETAGGADQLNLTLNLVKLQETKTGLCGHGDDDAQFHGNVVLRGFDELGEPLDLYMAHTEM